MIRRVTPLRIALAALGALQLFACNKPDDNGPMGTEVENEIVGEIFAQDGKPVPGAKVRIFPVSYTPQQGSPKRGQPQDGPFLSTTTDAKGRYVIDSLPRGEYNILAEKDGLLSYLDSVGIASSRETLPPDTLKAAGAVYGVVAVQPNHDPSTAVVEVLGTNVFVNVDRNGRFALPALGEGRYSVKVSTTLPEYTALFTGFAAQAGRSDTLTDTLRLQYNGIPVVTGIRMVGFDTLAGIVTFSWSKPDFPNLLGYSIYRDEAKAEALSNMPINSYRVEDTTYSDTLHFGFGGDITASMSVEYRVRIKDRETNLGPVYYFLRVNLPPPAAASTVIGLRAEGTRNNVASIGDTLRIVGEFRNPGRNLTKLAWSQDGGNALRTRALSGRNGSDTIVVVFTNPANPVIELMVEDDAGRRWTRSILLNIVLDPPFVFAGNDTSVFLGDSLWVTGVASDRFGSIRKWEWDLHGKGDFVTFPDAGPVKVLLPNAIVDDFPITLRVTDDDGTTQSSTRHIAVSRSKYLPQLPITMHKPELVVLSGILYVFDSSTKRGFSYDPVRKDWSELPQRIASRSGFAVLAFNGKIYLVGGGDGGCCSDGPDNAVEAFDPVLNRWELKANLNFPRGSTRIVVSNGRIMAISPGNENLSREFAEVYDEVKDTWTLMPNPTGWFDGKLFWNGDHFDNIGYTAAGGALGIGRFSDSLARIAPTINIALGCDGSMPTQFAQGEGVIYAAGPDLCRSSDPQTNLWAIDPNTGSFKSLPPLRNGVSQNRSIAVLGNRLFLFGGYGDFPNRNVEEYLLP